MPKSEDEIERALSNVIGSMAIEGVTLDDEAIARCRGIISGELNVDEEVEKLFEQFREGQSKQ